MKKLSLACFSVFLILAIFYFSGDKIKHLVGKNSITQRSPVRVSIQIPSSEELKKKGKAGSENSAQIKIEKDQLTQQEVIKVIIPKGKRLYDEEKMKEVSYDANIEYLNRENENH